ncbi:MAG TPA: hypothetical protein VF828_00460 [Patescibacteria group bacterium]
MTLLSRQQMLGIREEISSQFGVSETTEVDAAAQITRLGEIANHNVLPGCRDCAAAEMCLEEGPHCVEAKQTAIRGERSL